MNWEQKSWNKIPQGIWISGNWYAENGKGSTKLVYFSLPFYIAYQISSYNFHIFTYNSQIKATANTFDIKKLKNIYHIKK